MDMTTGTIVNVPHFNASQAGANTRPASAGGFTAQAARWAMGAACVLAGCTGEEPPPPVVAPAGGAGPYASYYTAGEIKFLDAVATNAPTDGVAALAFTDVNGNQVALSDYVDRKHVVLVITRGNTNPICPYCSTQTARLISAYDQFVEQDAEVVLVYPIESTGDSDKLAAFLADARGRLDDPGREVPFPVLIDVQLKSVDQLGIRKDLSKPATYIIDKEGQVRFAYVGEHLADRPSADSLLGQLATLNADAPETQAAAESDDPDAG